MQNGFNFYDSKQNGPHIPDSLFQLPHNYKFWAIFQWYALYIYNC